MCRSKRSPGRKVAVGRVALVVDDMMAMRKLVGHTLVRAGFEVLEAANGNEALARVQGRKVDFVIADLNMPVMDGIELIRALRADPEHARTPAVLLTTELEPARKEEARSAGATGWIVKPFDPATLMTAVSRLVP
jgi:two-component system chemotaxis response regulator CheY